MSNKTEGVQKELGFLRRNINKVKASVDRAAEKMGGGSKQAEKLRDSSEKLLTEREGVTKAKENAGKLKKEYDDLASKWSRNSSMQPSITQRRLKSAFADQSVKGAEQHLDKAALKLVRKRGYTRLGRIAGLGALGLGALKAYNSENKDSNELGQDENQQQNIPNYGFDTDDNGNVVFYDNAHQLYDDYIQGSDGTVYNRNGQIIGNVADQDAMLSAGYDNIFDYNAAQALGKRITPEQVATMQQMLGVTSDGKWGARTQAAYENTVNNFMKQRYPNSLFTVYQ